MERLLEFSAQTTQFGLLIIYLLPLYLGLAVALYPSVQAILDRIEQFYMLFSFSNPML